MSRIGSLCSCIYHCIEVEQNVRQLKQPNAQRHQIDFSHLFLRWKLIDFFLCYLFICEESLYTKIIKQVLLHFKIKLGHLIIMQLLKTQK